MAPGAGGRWLLHTMVGSIARSRSRAWPKASRSTSCTQAESMVAQRTCPARSSSASRSAAFWGTAGSSAPKQSELNRMPVRSSTKPVVIGLS